MGGGKKNERENKLHFYNNISDWSNFSSECNNADISCIYE